MDLTLCEYCGKKKGKYREALRLRVCADCLRWLKNRMRGALRQRVTETDEDDYKEAVKEGERHNVARSAEESNAWTASTIPDTTLRTPAASSASLSPSI
jgi:hypothetical protein